MKFFGTARSLRPLRWLLLSTLLIALGDQATRYAGGTENVFSLGTPANAQAVLVNSNSNGDLVSGKRGLQEEVTTEEVAKPTDVRSLTIYPEPFFSNEQIKNGGFLLYIVGKFECATD